MSMRAAGLRLMVRPWWWAVGIPEAWQVVRGMVSTTGARAAACLRRVPLR